MKKKNELVTIFILNWNREKETLRAIDSAIKQTYKNIEILVVDNGSTDSSVSSIKKKYNNIVKLVELPENYGCPGGRNRGIEYCNGKYILFLDNDGILHKDAVKNAVKAIKQNSEYFVVTGHVYDFLNEEEIDSSFEISYDSNNIKVRSFQGGISLHRKLIYDLIGYYPDDFMYGGEEQHLSLRILEYGKIIVKNKSVILWHKKSDIARDKTNEEIQAMLNTFVTYYELWPWFLFLLFFVKYIFFYTFLAFKSNYGILFIRRNLKELPKRIKKIKRKAISLSAISLGKRLPNFYEV